MTTKRIYLYPRFNRFWHWIQAIIVIGLLYSGFEIHGTFNFMEYEAAVELHNSMIWGLLILIAFAVFWHFTTGQWRQYIPTTKFLTEMVRFYLVGIFRNEPHPTSKTELTKLNPLQRLTYIGLKILVFPIQIGSGLAYFYYNELAASNFPLSLQTIAFFHVAAAFCLLSFVVAHIYLTTTGHKVTSNIKAMITGWEEVEEEQC